MGTATSTDISEGKYSGIWNKSRFFPVLLQIGNISSKTLYDSHHKEECFSLGTGHYLPSGGAGSEDFRLKTVILADPPLNDISLK